jgi:hypothetical protein
MNMMTPISTTSPSSGALAARALIVALKISQWEGRRVDRAVTRQVKAQHGASDDAGNFNKLLVRKEALEPIQKIANETGAEFRKRTLPWMDAGGRIMAADAFMAHAAWMRGQEAKFQAAVSDFLRGYPNHVQAASARLGSMFDHTDYPSVDDLRGKFSMEVKVLPVPTAADFRVEMSDAQVARIRSEIETTVTDATAAAVRDVYERIADKVGHMVERLGAYKPAKRKGDRAEGIFRDSLVENIRDLIDVLPALNITGDPALAAMGDRLFELARFDAAVLREDAEVRRNVATEAQAILDSIGGFLA